MKRTLINVMLPVLSVLAASAQAVGPCGVYEGADKADGLTRQGYMEIDVSGASVPDFSQTFKKGGKYSFKLLPPDFMKKPSQYFAGKRATGFVKFRSKILISNTETLMLSDPEPAEGGYRLRWASDMGKTGTCMLHVRADGTLWFTGLGTFHESIGPDKLVFVRQAEPSAKKPYLSGGGAGNGGGAGASATDGAPATADGSSATVTGSSAAGTDGVPMFKPETDAGGNIQLPAESSGTLTGRWMGRDGLMIKLNSVKKPYTYTRKAYHGIIEMNGPGYIKEGVVAVRQQSPRCVGLYSIPLDTDVKEIHYSEIRVGDDGRSLSYHLCGGVAVRTQLFKLITDTAVYDLWPLEPQYYGMFSTGSEVVPVPLNFYFKQSYDNGAGEMKEGYGCLTISYNMGGYIDNDLIYEAKILDNGNVGIKYRCGRTDNKYSAVLVWDKPKSSWTVTQVKRLSGDGDDCYMMNDPLIKLVGDIK